MKKIKKGARVICSLYGNQEAKVDYYNPTTGDVDLRYKGSKATWTAHESQCKIQ